MATEKKFSFRTIFSLNTIENSKTQPERTTAGEKKFIKEVAKYIEKKGDVTKIQFERLNRIKEKLIIKS